MQRLEERIEEAMIAILHDHTFYWTILASLERSYINSEEELPGCYYAATDGFSKLIFNRENCAELLDEQLISLLLHECKHVAHFHPMRREDRWHPLWNLATDYAVNGQLVEERIPLPPGAMYREDFLGWSPEAIYPVLEQENQELEDDAKGDDANDGSDGSDNNASSGSGQACGPDHSAPPGDRQSGTGHQEGGGKDSQPGSVNGDDGRGAPEQQDGDSSPEGEDEESECGDSQAGGDAEGNSAPGTAAGKTKLRLTLDWTHGDLMTRLADDWQNKPPEEQADARQKIEALRQRAAMIAQAAGKDLRAVAMHNAHSTQPPDWRQTLRSFVYNAVQREDYTWSKPNRRFTPHGIYLPSLKGSEHPETLVLAIDNSASISRRQLQLFLEEISSLMVELPMTTFHVILCDTRVNGYHKLTALDLPLTFEVEARGGTDYTPVFEYIEDEKLLPNALVYFTDLECYDYPEEAPDYPTLWLNYGRPKPTHEEAIRQAITRERKRITNIYGQRSNKLMTDRQVLMRCEIPPFGDTVNMEKIL